jgi:hypothetical protein
MTDGDASPPNMRPLTVRGHRTPSGKFHGSDARGDVGGITYSRRRRDAGYVVAIDCAITEIPNPQSVGLPLAARFRT